MKFKKAFKKGSKCLIKLELDNSEEKWAETSQTVYNYASKAFKEGDVIGIEYREEGKQMFIDRVNKEGKMIKTTGTPKEESKPAVKPKTTDGPVCEDCGIGVKDDKYKKCYTCNQKNPSKGTSSKRSPEVQNSIKMQCAYKVAGMAIQVMTGQIEDVDTIKEMLDNIAEHVSKKF